MDTAGQRPWLSVVIPAHDEAASLTRYLPEVMAVLGRMSRTFEVVVVDDGSRDATAEIAVAAGARVIRHAQRQGYGVTVTDGLKAAEGELVAYVDGDAQFDIGELDLLLAELAQGPFDLVAGVREGRVDPLHRVLIGEAYNAFMRRVTATDLTDMDCGFKLMRREVVERIELHCLGNLFGAELLSKAKRAGFSVRQVPVSHRKRATGRSKGVDPFALGHALWELVRYWSELRPGA